MQPTEDGAGRDATREFFDGVEAPDFAAWANDDDLSPPDPPEFSDWKHDSPDEPCRTESPDWPAEQHVGGSATGDASAPGLADAPPAAPAAAGETGALGPQEAATPAPRGEAFPDPSLDADAETAKSGSANEGLREPARARSISEDTRGRERRARLKEFAARLWTDAVPAPVAACERHLICTLAGEQFALPLSGVQEVQRSPLVAPLPHAPDWLLGVTNQRGEVLSVVDLAAFLGVGVAALSPQRRLVVVRAGRDEMTTGLVVDRVCGIRALPVGEIAPPALLVAPHVRGIWGGGDELAAVLDLDELLLSPRMRRLEPD